MTAAAPTLTDLAPARLGVGLVGFGLWGQKLARAFCRVERAWLSAVCDVAADARDRARTLAPVTASFDELLARDDVGAVVIATPPASHAALALAALRSGRDVMVEKPMALGLDDALMLEHAARQSGRVLMVGHILEYHPALVELAQRIARGELGRVRALVSERFGSSLRRHEDAWWSLGPHDVSVTRSLLGREPVRVSVRSDIGPDAVTARLEAGDGVVATACLSIVAPDKVRRIAVVGSEGAALFDDLDPRATLRFFDREASLDAALDGASIDVVVDRTKGRAVATPTAEPLLLEAEHFVAGALDAAPVLTDAESGRRVVAVLEAGARSLADHGRVVDVPMARLEKAG